MLSSPMSAALGMLFLSVGGAAIWLILDASKRAQNPSARDRRIRAHRLAGYSFIALFCVMTWFMILRAREMPQDLPPNTMLHMFIAMLLTPLIFVKVLIARYYKSYPTALPVPALDVSIFTLGFVLIASTAGPYFFRKVIIQDISLEALNLGRCRREWSWRRSRRCRSWAGPQPRAVESKPAANATLVSLPRLGELMPSCPGCLRTSRLAGGFQRSRTQQGIGTAPHLADVAAGIDEQCG